MTDDIVIKPGNIISHGWEFSVVIGGIRHTVRISHEYWKKLTHGNISPMEVVRLGMDYVRQRHALESLPGDVDLEELDNRVPDFTRTVRGLANVEAAGSAR